MQLNSHKYVIVLNGQSMNRVACDIYVIGTLLCSALY